MQVLHWQRQHSDIHWIKESSRARKKEGHGEENLASPADELSTCDCSGELLGGCDIIMELHQAGELKESIDEMRDRM